MDEDIKKLIIARLEVLPPDKKMSIGSAGEFTKDEIIECVKKENELGKKIVQIELEFLQSLKEGILTA